MHPRFSLAPVVAVAAGCFAIVAHGQVPTAAPAGDEAQMFPFVLPWDDAAPGVTDLSSWLPAPAGKDGYVVNKDGHLYTGGRRVRFFGVNTVFDASFPDHEDADKMAAHLAKYGIGCVRLHHMETEPAPVGLMKPDNATIDPDRLDRLDYFIGALKRHGIYVDINLHVGRMYPGFDKWPGMSGYFKGVDQFEPKMIASQRDFARDLLTHVNPYTHTAYTEEPAVAFVEINNENALMDEWWNGHFDGMPAIHRDELRRQWNAWLGKKYPSDDAMRAAWDAGEQPAGAEMLNTEDCLRDWAVGQFGPAKMEDQAEPGPDSAANGARRVALITPGAEKWQGDFCHFHLPFKEGEAYTFTFQAKSDQPRSVMVAAANSGATYRQLATIHVPLTTEWKRCSFTFVAPFSINDARIGFLDMAGEKAAYDFADLSLKMAAISGLPAGQHLGAVEVIDKREFGGYTTAAQRDWIGFLYETEDEYWMGMDRYLKDDLHLHSLVVGTPMGWSPLSIQEQLDAIDSHGYWHHPNFPRKQWDMGDWTVKNEAMVNDPNGGLLGSLGRIRAPGKPFICTEYNEAAPNTFGSETMPLLGAYAARQDWDAFFIFAYSHQLDAMKAGAFRSFFDISQNPTKLATVVPAAAMFVRGDVKAAAPQIVTVPKDDIIDLIRRDGPNIRPDKFGVDARAALRHPVEMKFGVGGTMASEATPAPEAAGGPPVASDTGELHWGEQPKRGLVTIDAPRSQGMVGFAAGEPVKLSALTITPQASATGLATINATVMDGKDFASARRVLLTATGLDSNTGMKWKSAAKDSVGNDWGSAPAVVEGIRATVVFPAWPGAKAWALDARGQRVTPVPMTAGVDGRATIEIGPQWKTLWYEIEVPGR